MRLSWDDGLRYPLGKMNREEAKFIYNIGYRVAGIAGPLDATEDDINYAKDVVAEAGLVMGPFWIGRAAFRPDPEQHRENQNAIIAALRIAGKLGLPPPRLLCREHASGKHLHASSRKSHSKGARYSDKTHTRTCPLCRGCRLYALSRNDTVDHCQQHRANERVCRACGLAVFTDLS